MSYAMLFETLDTGGVCSIARGLARNVGSYKGHLAQCDLPRRNDLDGRGHLNEEGLASFTHFFLETCLDQVRFMVELIQPDRLRNRILPWDEEEVRADVLPQKAGRILEAILYRGELSRGDVPNKAARHERPPYPPSRGRTDRTRRYRFGKHTRTVAPHLSRQAGATLDARAISGI